MLKFADIGRAASKQSLKISTIPPKKIKNTSTQGNRIDEKGSLKFVQRIFSKCKGSNSLSIKVPIAVCMMIRIVEFRWWCGLTYSGLFVQDLSKDSGRESPVARPANMNHTPVPDRPHNDSNVNQVEEMETQDGE